MRERPGFEGVTEICTIPGNAPSIMRLEHARLTSPLKPNPTALRQDRDMTGRHKPGWEFRGVKMTGVMSPGSGRALRFDPHHLPVRYAARDNGADEQVRDIELDRERVVFRREVRGIPMRIGVNMAEFAGVTMRSLPPRGRRTRRGRHHALTLRQRADRAAVRRGRRRRRDGAMEIMEPRARRSAAGGRWRRELARAAPLDRPARRGRHSILMRRKPGRPSATPTIHRDEREIIARN